MSKKDDDNGKRLVTIIVRSAFDLFKCEEVIRDCLKKVDLSELEILLAFESIKIKSLSRGLTTHVSVLSDNRGGMECNGMKKLCKCLEKSGFYIQFIPDYYSFIPNKK